MLLSNLSVRFMPPIIVVIPLLSLMRQLHLIHTRLGLTLVYAAAELVEAAMVDGATEMGALWRVVIPIALPGWWRPDCSACCCRGMSSRSRSF